MKKILLLLFLLPALSGFGQQLSITGKITDKETQEPLQGANILLKGTFEGKVSDQKGEFEFSFKNKTNQVILVSFLGYSTVEIDVNKDTPLPLNIQLEKTYIQGQEVVISASRTNEKLFEAPSTIIKLNEDKLMNLPASDFYYALGTQKGIDMISNNFGFAAFNTRGFNSTQPYRVSQYIDGMDNNSVGLSFSPGNMFGVSSIDIDNVEVISGPASALYGSNALQGVLSIQSKNPFEYEGLSGVIKGGTRNYTDVELRYGKAFGNKKKWAIKLVGSYFEADDWEADNPILNKYKVIPTAQQNFMNTVNADTNYAKFKTYSDLYTSARPASKSFMLPGYMEQDLSAQRSKGTKLSGSVYYRFNPNSELSYTYKYSQATGVFQGNNRAYLSDFIYQQHKIQFKNKNLTLLGYYSIDDANKTYDLGLTGINMGLASLPNVDKLYLQQYVHTIDSLSNGFTQPFDSSMLTAALLNAKASADKGWLKPGTKEFTQTFNSITSNPDRPSGSRYPNLSSVLNFDGSYKINQRFADIILGASMKYYFPNTNGKIFVDTNGRDISYYELGAYLQAGKELFNKKIKLLASARIDKSQNFDMQLSPRFSIMYSFNKNNNIRLAWQSAFRNPTINDQYYFLNTGSFIVVGNLDGYKNLYTASSVTAYQNSGNTNTALLKKIVLDPVKAEHIKTIELGYRSVLKKRLTIDLNAFYNTYDNFIGSIKAVEPKKGIAGDSTGVIDINTRNYKTYSISVNSSSKVETYGGGIDLTFYISKGISTYLNYTYNILYKKDKTDPFIPGFNTPENKLNFGLTGKKIFKGLGFAVNFQWVDKYLWESAFATGNVSSYNTLDLQLIYELPEYNSTVRLGGTNILGKEYYSAYGSSAIGPFFFASFTYNLKNI
jgi:iron complex outermembrane recepter protein